MAKVRILHDRVANQIAAGEVIERPAAVVKELVENALDAGATRIEVEFRHGGRSLMRVEDNGSGMSRDDALLALERHATSKIVEAADLDRLASYGFRGEALPSIASVSRFLMQTREAGSEAGSEILVNGGKFVHVRECGRPVGTCIEVTHLFNSVPARRKFLKTDQTEAAHIVHCVRLYALACPRTAFTLIEDGRVIFRSPECSTLEERVTEIFGRQVAESLIPIACDEPGLRLTGLIGRPGVGRSTRHEMIVFVNARPVDSRTLNYALIESYSESLPKGRYPLAFVFFECAPAGLSSTSPFDPAPVVGDIHHPQTGSDRPEAVMRSLIQRHLVSTLARHSGSATPRDWWVATVLSLRDSIHERMIATQAVHNAQNVRRIYYFSLEYLMGRLFGNNLLATGLYETTREALASLGQDFETAVSAVSPRASSIRWRPWIIRRSATASTTSSACSSRRSSTGTRWSIPTAGRSSVTRGKSSAPSTRRRCGCTAGWRTCSTIGATTARAGSTPRPSSACRTTSRSLATAPRR